MSCNLSKYTTYNVGRVVHDNATGAYTAQLVQPPSSCPDTVFSSKKAIIKVVDGINPQLSFDVLANKPVILVPRSGYVEQVGSSGVGTGMTLFFILAMFGMIGIAIYYALKREARLSPSTGGATPSGSGPYNSGGPSGGGGTTIINNGGSNDGLLTGVMLGSMMSNNRSERVIEKETTIIERDSSPSRDSDDSYSSDSGSDSSSSFSSDSSSDSSSSFSSDSGGSSFSSDSGGGSFSSDS